MLDQLIADIKSEFPDFKIVYKADSGFMKAINVFLLIVTFGQMKAFMADYTTTIGHTVYVPSGWDSWAEQSRVIILRHERVHMRQQKKYSRPVFTFLYLIPIFPVFLAYWRARLELEAYTETIQATVDLHGTAMVLSHDFKNKLINQFTTSAYGWMWPFKGTVTKWIDQAVDQVVDAYAKGSKQ